MCICGLSEFLLDFSRLLGYNNPSGLLAEYAKGKRYEPLAQLAEHLTFNQGVRGSNPRWFTNKKPHEIAVFRLFHAVLFCLEIGFGYLLTIMEGKSGFNVSSDVSVQR